MSISCTVNNLDSDTMTVTEKLAATGDITAAVTLGVTEYPYHADGGKVRHVPGPGYHIVVCGLQELCHPADHLLQLPAGLAQFECHQQVLGDTVLWQSATGRFGR